MKLSILTGLVFSCSLVVSFNPRPFDENLKRRQSTDNNASSLQFDLGYSIYQGIYNEVIDINEWKGIRYAAPPIGSLRWQAPQTPTVNRSSIISASSIPYQCPQALPNFGEARDVQNLPVFIWIHGGGYGAGNRSQNLESIIRTNDNSFIGVSIQYRLGAFGFFIQQLPSVQLQKKQVNGLRVLSGNNALEGPLFVPQNITSEDDLVSWIQDVFPMFTTDDVSKLLRYYPSSNATDDKNAVDYATSGYTGVTANDNIYAETTFVCPSYWLAEAYTNNGREAWKYQYSVPAALHGVDISGYFGLGSPSQGPDFLRAFMTIFGKFITEDNPSISSSIAAGNSSTVASNSSQSLIDWLAYTNANPYQLNLNETGGEGFSAAGVTFAGTLINVTQYRNPGLTNNFTLVNAFSWEGGRGIRCDFWRSVGPIVPE